jgi:sugar (pentulose or hexulose) kinase
MTLERPNRSRFKANPVVLAWEGFRGFIGVRLFLVPPPHSPIVSAPSAFNAIWLALRRLAANARALVVHKRLMGAHLGVAILLLSACADKPPIVSADTSCERFRHISANDAQIKVFSDNWEGMESYADAVVAHNITYDEHCLKVEK